MKLCTYPILHKNILFIYVFNSMGYNQLLSAFILMLEWFQS